jgi:hypothetical protein
MPSTFKLSTLLENSFAASSTRSAITHTVPQVITSISDYWSVAAEFTGIGSNVITTVAGPPITITVGGTPQIDPITRQTISVLKVHGYIVYVGRAVAATPPTGTLNLTTSGIVGSTITGTTLQEGSLVSVHVPTIANAAGSQSLTVALATTTGYKVSVVVYGSSSPPV